MSKTTPIDVSCPHCGSSEVHGNERVLVTARISGFHLTEDGKLKPQWAGGGEAAWDTQEPVHENQPYFCTDCDKGLRAEDLLPGAKAPPVLTKEQRKELVDKLCKDLVEGASRPNLALWDMAEKGYVGFSQRTDAELLDAHRDAFDEDFLPVEGKRR